MLYNTATILAYVTRVNLLLIPAEVLGLVTFHNLVKKINLSKTEKKSH